MDFTQLTSEQLFDLITNASVGGISISSIIIFAITAMKNHSKFLKADGLCNSKDMQIETLLSEVRQMSKVIGTLISAITTFILSSPSVNGKVKAEIAGIVKKSIIGMDLGLDNLTEKALDILTECTEVDTYTETKNKIKNNTEQNEEIIRDIEEKTNSVNQIKI